MAMLDDYDERRKRKYKNEIKKKKDWKF